jgi:hypothetical protein
MEEALLERATELASRVSRRAPHLPATAPLASPSGTALGRNLDALLSALQIDEAGDLRSAAPGAATSSRPSFLHRSSPPRIVRDP